MIKKPKRSEASIEASIVKMLKAALMWALKFRSIARSAGPDRLVLAPPTCSHCKRGVAFFLEVKRPGEVATPLQEQYHKDLRQYGFFVAVVTSKAEALIAAAEALKNRC